MLIAMSTGAAILYLALGVLGVSIITMLTVLFTRWATKGLTDTQRATILAMNTYENMTHQTDPSYWDGSNNHSNHNGDNK